MRIVVEIEVTDWTKENIDAFHDWLVDEINMGNMSTDDDARVVSVKKVVEKKKKSSNKKK